MVNQLTANNCENISHIEVSTETLHKGEKIYNTSKKEGINHGPQAKKGKKYQGGQGGGEPKKPHVIDPWSTELKEVM